jgi:L-alanine-DL-glutamate epimerase-like enolase superfamily enzyme
LGIQRIEVFPVTLHYHEPFTISAGSSLESHNVIVKIVTDYDVVGWGEASPSKRVTNETQETVLQALDKIAPKLIGECPLCIEKDMEIMDKTVQGNSSAKAAVDMALHDILGKTTKKPLFMVLGGYKKEILTDITLSLKTPKEMAEDAAKAVKEGFRALKLKIGVNPQEDIERVRLVRETVGNKIDIRVDANQGWTPQQAIEVLRKIEPYNIQFCEQPVNVQNIHEMAKIRVASPIPIMADESVHTPSDALRLIYENAVDFINIKLMKCGGISNARKIAAIAEAANIPCMIGCMGESNIGISAAVHVALATRNIQYADLDCDILLKDRLVTKGGAQIEDSKRFSTWDAGLGILKINEKLLGKPIKVYGK